VWGLYRETNSLDPIYAFDYPENTVLSMLWIPERVAAPLGMAA